MSTVRVGLHSAGGVGSVYHPAFRGPIRVGVTEVSDDPDQQVIDTLHIMMGYVLEDSGSTEVLADAREASAGAANELEAVERVYSYVRSKLQFVRDEQLTSSFQTQTEIPIVEALIRPKDMAVMCGDGSCRRVGDCDDFSMYIAALLRACGIRSSFVVVAADSRDPGRYSHVYVAAYLSDGRRIPLDASHGTYPGWETGNLYGKRLEIALAPADLGRRLPLLVAVAALGLLLCWPMRRARAA